MLSSAGKDPHVFIRTVEPSTQCGFANKIGWPQFGFCLLLCCTSHLTRNWFVLEQNALVSTACFRYTPRITRTFSLFRLRPPKPLTQIICGEKRRTLLFPCNSEIETTLCLIPQTHENNIYTTHTHVRSHWINWREGPTSIVLNDKHMFTH